MFQQIDCIYQGLDVLASTLVKDHTRTRTISSCLLQLTLANCRFGECELVSTCYTMGCCILATPYTAYTLSASEHAPGLQSSFCTFDSSQLQCCEICTGLCRFTGHWHTALKLYSLILNALKRKHQKMVGVHASMTQQSLPGGHVICCRSLMAS